MINDDGKEVVLSQCMVDGTQGVTKAINNMYEQATTIPTIQIRWGMIERGIQMEMRRGIRLTAKAPAASAIVKREYGVRKGMSKAKTLLCWRMLLNLTGMMIKERGEEE
jgi:hypothetical protein